MTAGRDPEAETRMRLGPDERRTLNCIERPIGESVSLTLDEGVLLLRIQVVGANAPVLGPSGAWVPPAASGQRSPFTTIKTAYGAAIVAYRSPETEGWPDLVLSGLSGARLVILRASGASADQDRWFPILSTGRIPRVETSRHADGLDVQQKVVDLFRAQGNRSLGELAVRSLSVKRPSETQDALVGAILDELSSVSDRDMSALGIKLMMISGRE